MRLSWGYLATLPGLLVLSACGGDTGESVSQEPERPALTAATLGEQTLLSNTEYLALEPFLAADIEKGARQAQICKACHSLNKGGANMIGPALHGFFGTIAGKQVGFAYSPALANASFVWTPRALDAWLAQPGRFLPGNRMSFAGVFNPQDRNNLIAYLLGETAADAADQP